MAVAVERAAPASARPRLRTDRWALAALMGGPALLVLAAGRHGPGVSPDSVSYASAARSLAATGRLTIYTGEPLTVFPPGLPLLLGLFTALGLDLEVVVLALHAVCAAVTVGLTFLLARAVLDRSTGWAYAAAGVVAVSPALVGTYAMLWTEPLFVVCVLGLLLVCVRAVRRRRFGWGAAVAVALLVSAATTLRFVGFVLIPVVFLAAWLAAVDRGRVRAVLAAVPPALLASLGLVVVVARNLALGSAPLGERYPSGLSVPEVGRRTLVALGEYAVPSGVSTPAAASVGVLLAGLVGYGAIAAVRRRDRPAVLLVGLTGLYWLSLWYGQLSTQIDPVNARLMSPVFTPMVLLALFGLGELYDACASGPGRRAARVRLAALVVLVLFLLGSVAVALRLTVTAAERGRGFNRTDLTASPLAAAVTALPPGTGIAANNPALAYWTTGREPVVPVPGRGHYSGQRQTDLAGAALAARVRTGAVDRLVYFAVSEEGLSPEELARYGIETQLDARYPDGTIWRVSVP